MTTDEMFSLYRVMKSLEDQAVYYREQWQSVIKDSEAAMTSPFKRCPDCQKAFRAVDADEVLEAHDLEPI